MAWRSLFPDVAAAKRSWWLVVYGETVDHCLANPGFDVDLYVKSAPAPPPDAGQAAAFGR